MGQTIFAALLAVEVICDGQIVACCACSTGVLINVSIIIEIFDFFIIATFLPSLT